jgi:hypothetical protein
MAATVITAVTVNRKQARAEPHLYCTAPLWRPHQRFFSHHSVFYFQNWQFLSLSGKR